MDAGEIWVEAEQNMASVRLGAPNPYCTVPRTVRTWLKRQNCLLLHSSNPAKHFSLCSSFLPFEENIETLSNLHQDHFRLFQNFTKLDLVPFFTTYLNQKPQIQKKIHSPLLETFSPRIFRFEIKFNLEVFRWNWCHRYSSHTKPNKCCKSRRFPSSLAGFVHRNLRRNLPENRF